MVHNHEPQLSRWHCYQQTNTLLDCQLLQYYSVGRPEILPSAGIAFSCSNMCLLLTLGSSNMLACTLWLRPSKATIWHSWWDNQCRDLLTLNCIDTSVSTLKQPMDNPEEPSSSSESPSSTITSLLFWTVSETKASAVEMQLMGMVEARSWSSWLKSTAISHREIVSVAMLLACYLEYFSIFRRVVTLNVHFWRCIDTSIIKSHSTQIQMCCYGRYFKATDWSSESVFQPTHPAPHFLFTQRQLQRTLLKWHHKLFDTLILP